MEVHYISLKYTLYTSVYVNMSTYVGVFFHVFIIFVDIVLIKASLGWVTCPV